MRKIPVILFIVYSFYSIHLIAAELDQPNEPTECPGVNSTCWVAEQNRFLIFKLEKPTFYKVFRNQDNSRFDISLVLDNKHMKLEEYAVKLRANSSAIIFGKELMLEKNVDLGSEITNGFYQRLTLLKIEKGNWTLNGSPGKDLTPLAPIAVLDDRRFIRLCFKQQIPKIGQPGIVIFQDDELLKMSNTETVVISKGGCIDLKAKKLFIGFKAEPELTKSYSLSGWFSVDLSPKKVEEDNY